MLGPVEIWDQDRCIPVGASKAQHVLAILLLASGLSVSTGSIADRLWDGNPPIKERETLQVYISRLRTKLREAGDTVGLIRANRSGGYLLDVPAELVDARRFDQAVTRARSTAVSDPEAAVSLFRQAEALWGGEPLAGLVGQWADGTRRALWERRRSAVLTRIDLELRLGSDPDELVSELAALTAIGGVDQAAVGMLMRALAQAGRLADALSTFREARKRLRSEIGADPNPELRFLHQRILKGELAPRSPRRSGTHGPAGGSQTGSGAAVDQSEKPPDNLDRGPRYLVGRETELADVLAAVRTDLGSGSSGPSIFAIDGMPGIGKTSFAVRIAHLLRDDCPDGRIQINFRSHHPHQSPIGPLEALRQLLDEIGAPVQDVGRAESVDALSALWRRRIYGKRLLLLLDDVQSLEQVECLLPTAPGAAVLLTSRRQLGTMSGLRQRSLSTLPDEAAHALLADITERSFAAEVDAEALGRFTAHCGGLPLAITVSAAHLRKRPNWKLGDLVARLDTPGHRSADDQITGPVDSAIALSFYSLSAQLRTLLCRLAGHPGPDIGLPAAAALAQSDATGTDLALDALVEHHLIEETTRHRYRLHDLIREFALDRAWHEQTLDDVEDAVHRTFLLYLQTAERAGRTLYPSEPASHNTSQPQSIAEPADLAGVAIDVDSRKSVRAWLDLESANLTAILEFASAHGWRGPTTSLLHILAGHLDRRGHWREAIELLRKAATDVPDLQSASTDPSEDFATAAQIHTDLAAFYARAGELEKALTHATAAVTIWTVNKHPYGQAEATLHSGRIHWLSGRRTEAVEDFRVAAEMFGGLGAPERRATAEYHLGIGLFELGQLDAAFECMQRVLSAASALGDAELRCDVLINLGKMHLIADECDVAMAYFHQAQPLAAESGDPQCLAVLATNIGAVHRRRGQADLALASFRQALAWSRSGADHRNEAETLVEAAVAHADLGNSGIAARQLSRALHLAEESEDPLQSSHVHLATGILHQRGGDRTAALDCYTTALAEAESAQAPLDQAHALRAIGELLAPEEPTASRRYLARAKDLYQRLGLHRAASATTLIR
ncbi:BTAD domain-containing putative transcriptional regulator [Catenulispora sp. GP43]|uniref:AfsR/SARP family transcriptional regulator n=1 Tax=Catenulispora sp. GP43 TaxID=3156263 RepID=UPI003519978C